MNKREQGMRYRALVLRALSHLGYATTRQLAKIVWRGCDESSRKMAGRSLRWLLAQGYIVSRRNGNSVNGEMLVAVTKAGANWLVEHDEPLPHKDGEVAKAHARDWLRHAHSHRTACNSVYAARVGLSHDRFAWSELEIRSGLSPLGYIAYRHNEQTLHKIPDVLFEHPDGLIWVEVENAPRSEKDIAKVVASMRRMAIDRRIAEIHFVITTPGAKTIGQRLRKALTHAPDSAWPRQVKEWDAVLLAKKVKVFTLNSETLELTPVEF